MNFTTRNKEVIVYLSILCILVGIIIGKALCYYEGHSQISKESIEISYIKIKPLSEMFPKPPPITFTPDPVPFYPLSDYERWIAECLVEGESGNQSFRGRKLVAQCIYNACVQDDLTPSEVRIKYGYVGWSETVSEKSKEAVVAVFDNGELEVEDNILWFYNPAGGRAKFHESQRWVLTEQNHKFFAPWN